MIAIVGKKAGMTQIFDENGVSQPVSLIKVDANMVVGDRTQEKDGYSAVVVGTGEKKGRQLSKPYAGQFRGGLQPADRLVELRDFGADYQIGTPLSVTLFAGCQRVDVRGISKGKGFQGVMRRHGFSGGRKSHGSKFHRTAGSTGQAATPSRVPKGQRMAGRMGGQRVTVQNLRLIRIMEEHGLLLIAGSVPGRNGAYVVVSAAVKNGSHT